MIDPSPALMALLNREPPEVLYHYTSLVGLDGIAASKKVWASAAQYTNDAREFRLALDIARRHLSDAAHEAAHPGRTTILTYLRDQVERAEDLEVCLFSLSEEGDLLSQWRAYCPPNGGYSLGFDARALRRLVPMQGVHLAPCVYDGGSHERMVKDALRPLLQAVPDAPEGTEGELEEVGERLAATMFGQIVFIAPLIKHASFEEEREWRLIRIPGRGGDLLPLQYRTGPGLYVPYVAISIVDPATGSVPFEELIIGPMPHQDAASRALLGALPARDFRPHSTRYSTVPYRTW